ncbi:hypothetical protein LXL04_015740 [Taraxacum kok-saghyz]
MEPGGTEDSKNEEVRNEEPRKLLGGCSTSFFQQSPNICFLLKNPKYWVKFSNWFCLHATRGKQDQFENFTQYFGFFIQRGSVPASSATFSLPSHSTGIRVHSMETYDPNLKISQSNLADSDSLAIKLSPDWNVAKLTRKLIHLNHCLIELFTEKSQHFGHFFNKVLSFFFTKKPKILGKVFKLVLFTSCSRLYGVEP